LAWKRLVAHGEDLVDDQDVGVDVDRDREGEAHVHAARIELHLGVDEVFDLTERHDVVEDARRRIRLESPSIAP
jgi:divalent metal cation (Fe/Co/Zn/Cd) transporter